MSTADKPRIIFFGTPEFAVASLDILFRNHYPIVAVITAPDKPAGRGLALKPSAVKEYALRHNLSVIQPEDLKEKTFLDQLRSLTPAIGVVVAFRKLPSEVWSMPTFGTFNLHASLLPAYRGAAPINRAIMNGETETGVTTFFLNEKIDEGKILFRCKERISEADTAGTLYDRLMKNGADLVLKTVRAIESGTHKAEDQDTLVKAGEKPSPAPKIFKNDCRIDWTKSGRKIYDQIRGLSPYPGAWTEISKGDQKEVFKVFSSRFETDVKQELYSLKAGSNSIEVGLKDGVLHLTDVQLAGRKRMPAAELLKGFDPRSWKLITS